MGPNGFRRLALAAGTLPAPSPPAARRVAEREEPRPRRGATPAPARAWETEALAYRPPPRS